MVVVNCVVPVVLTSRIMPAMVRRGRGAIIIVGSVAGRQPLPLHAVYSATKGFDLLFGEGLWGELRGTGIDALVVEQGPTATEYQAVAGESVGTDHGEPAENVVRVALDALGKQPSVISGWFNWVRANAVRIVPRSTAAIIAKRVIEGQTRQTCARYRGARQAGVRYASKPRSGFHGVAIGKSHRLSHSRFACGHRGRRERATLLRHHRAGALPGTRGLRSAGRLARRADATDRMFDTPLTLAIVHRV